MKKKSFPNIELLAENILEHRRLYYNGNPSISDYEYDKLEESLKTLDPEHPIFSLVGSENTSKSLKIKHETPMLSLAKTYSIKELLAWQKDRELIATHKIDGNSLSLIFEKGALSSGQTRGNGIYGENVTNKIKWLRSCPRHIETKLPNGKKPDSYKIEVRGEVYCTQDNFFALIETMKNYNLELPKNPRNIVAGILGRKKHTHLSRFFSFFAFDIKVYTSETFFLHEIDKYKWLAHAGFSLPEFKFLATEHDTRSYLNTVKKEIEQSQYGIDGAVFTYNDTKLHKKLGSTSHHPRYKMSFKWQGVSARTQIKDIIWSTSRLGIVTPVAQIEPTTLSGAKISKVTLHNAGFIKLHNIKVGDQIEIIRSGEVIPKFLQVTNSAKGNFYLPTKCPSCSTTLTEENIRLICNNQNCPSKLLKTILNWISSVGIEDLSEKRLLQLIKADLVKDICDLYSLSIKDFLSLGGMQEKLSLKLYTSIQKSKSIDLLSFLNGLGIASSGVNTWKSIIQEFNTLEKIQKISSEELENINGFAKKSATQITKGLREKAQLIKKLLAIEIIPYEEKTQPQSLQLQNQKFVISGSMSKPRKEIIEIIEQAGGKISSSVSKETTALIVSNIESQSSKTQKAVKLNIPIWTEVDLWEKLKYSAAN
jgi:DNA ligase (NAD+)